MSQAPKYTPNPVPDNPEDLPQYLLQEFQKIQGALEENPIAFIEEKNVEPSRVKQGDIVGTVGKTGRSTGAHLDIRLNWFDVKLDPASVLNLD